MFMNPIEDKNKTFVATWSISEAPIRIQEAILPLTRHFDFFLIAYQDRFGEVNNLEFLVNGRKL